MRTILLFPLVIAWGCDSGANPTRDWAGTVTDTAGVRIVQNPESGLWRADQKWRVEPDLSIGGTADPASQFGRVADVAADSRGRVYVLDQQARQVQVFDQAGGFLYALGGPGEGPGELSRFANAVLVSSLDSVYVPDYAQTRVNVYDAGGRSTGTLPLPPRPGGRSWEYLEDGRFLFRGLTISRDDAGRFRIGDGLFRTRSGGLDTLLAFDYPASDIGAPGAPVVPLIVIGAFWARLTNGLIAWSSLDRDHVRVHTQDGTLAHIIRHPAWRRTPIGDADRLRLRELLRTKLTMLGGDAASVDQLQLVYDEAFPAITSLRAGPDSTLWVQRMGDVAGIDAMAVNAEDAGPGLGGATWDVLDAEGRFLGTVTLPDRFRIYRITRTAVYGVRKDSLDVEHVERLTLIRGELDA